MSVRTFFAEHRKRKHDLDAARAAIDHLGEVLKAAVEVAKAPMTADDIEDEVMGVRDDPVDRPSR